MQQTREYALGKLVPLVKKSALGKEYGWYKSTTDKRVQLAKECCWPKILDGKIKWLAKMCIGQNSELAKN